MKYYYFAATLPMLSMETQAPFSSAIFKASCGQHMCSADLSALDELDAPSSSSESHPFSRAWTALDARIRDAVARIRCSRRHVDPAAYIRFPDRMDPYIENSVALAFAENTPLERELALDAIRWRGIDALAGSDPFDSFTVLGYYLKLKIVERWAGLTAQQGAKKLESMLESRPNLPWQTAADNPPIESDAALQEAQ